MYIKRDYWCVHTTGYLTKNIPHEWFLGWGKRADPVEGELIWDNFINAWWGFVKPFTWRWQFNLTGWHDFWFKPFEPWQDVRWHSGWSIYRKGATE